METKRARADRYMRGTKQLAEIEQVHEGRDQVRRCYRAFRRLLPAKRAELLQVLIAHVDLDDEGLALMRNYFGRS